MAQYEFSTSSQSDITAPKIKDDDSSSSTTTNSDFTRGLSSLSTEIKWMIFDQMLSNLCDSESDFSDYQRTLHTAKEFGLYDYHTHFSWLQDYHLCLSKDMQALSKVGYYTLLRSHFCQGIDRVTDINSWTGLDDEHTLLEDEVSGFKEQIVNFRELFFAADTLLEYLVRMPGSGHTVSELRFLSALNTYLPAEGEECNPEYVETMTASANELLDSMAMPHSPTEPYTSDPESRVWKLLEWFIFFAKECLFEMDQHMDQYVSFKTKLKEVLYEEEIGAAIIDLKRFHRKYVLGLGDEEDPIEDMPEEVAEQEVEEEEEREEEIISMERDEWSNYASDVSEAEEDDGSHLEPYQLAAHNSDYEADGEETVTDSEDGS